MKVGRWSAWVIFALPGGFSLPVTLVVETYRPYEAVHTQVPQAQAQAVLCEYAQRSVMGDMIAGKILGQEPAFREASGLFWMDMTCACQEMIARQRPAELFEGEDTND